MFRYTRILPVILLAGLALTWGMGSSATAGKEQVELDEASVFIEWNSTDTDFGVQFFWDGDPWTSMKVKDPSRKTALSVKVGGGAKMQGMTEGFFESHEPPASELSMEQFMARFPEGDYTFRGKGSDKVDLIGEAEFTHTLPAPPEGLYPEEDDVVSHTGFFAGFDPVTLDTEGDPIDIELYILVIEKENDDPILQVFEVILSPDEVWIPEEFLEPDTDYKLEVIAQEESGNRTITEEGEFTTTDD